MRKGTYKVRGMLAIVTCAWSDEPFTCLMILDSVTITMLMYLAALGHVCIQQKPGNFVKMETTTWAGLRIYMQIPAFTIMCGDKKCIPKDWSKGQRKRCFFCIMKRKMKHLRKELKKPQPSTTIVQVKWIYMIFDL